MPRWRTSSLIRASGTGRSARVVFALGVLAALAPSVGFTASSRITVVGAPSITRFDPVQGPVGTLVTVFGSDLAGATDVQFAGVSAGFSVVDNGEITATV